MNSAKIEVTRNEVGDWETFCFAPHLACALSARTWISREIAIEQASSHARHQHSGNAVVMVIDPDEPPKGRHRA